MCQIKKLVHSLGVWRGLKKKDEPYWIFVISGSWSSVVCVYVCVCVSFYIIIR